MSMIFFPVFMSIPSKDVAPFCMDCFDYETIFGILTLRSLKQSSSSSVSLIFISAFLVSCSLKKPTFETLSYGVFIVLVCFFKLLLYFILDIDLVGSSPELTLLCVVSALNST